MANAFGIDLGTSNIKIYNKSNDSIFVQKNVIAIENKTDVFAYGDSAYEMYEKAPANIQVSYPLSCGVIADIKNMETLVKLFLKDAQKGNYKGADFLIAVPTDITEVEKRAFWDLIRDAGVKTKRIKVVEKAIADALGAGIDIKNTQGVLLVDVGYETTEISLISLGGIVHSRLIKIGGLRFDDTIRQTVRKEFSLIIGGKTAENLKIRLNDLEKEGKKAVVYGRDIVTGLPVEREIPTKLVSDCLEEHFDVIVDHVRVMLEKTPPELAADIYRHGIYLTGGAAKTGQLSEKITEGTSLKVNLSDSPMTSVARGLGEILKNENFKSVNYAIERIVR